MIHVLNRILRILRTCLLLVHQSHSGKVFDPLITLIPSLSLNPQVKCYPILDGVMRWSKRCLFTCIWELVPLPPSKSTIGCRCVYVVKVDPDGQIGQLKAHLVTKGTQRFRRDCNDTFSPLAIAYGHLLLSIVIVLDWPLYHLYISWTSQMFSPGDLEDDVYMEQPLEFVLKESIVVVVLYVSCIDPYMVWNNLLEHDLVSSNMIIQDFGMTLSEVDHIVFNWSFMLMI